MNKILIFLLYYVKSEYAAKLDENTRFLFWNENAHRVFMERKQLNYFDVAYC